MFRNACVRPLSATVLVALCSVVFAGHLAAQNNTILLSKASINLSVQRGYNAPLQDINVIASVQNVNYTATAQGAQGWYFVAQPSASTPSTFTIVFATTTLPAGHYTGKVTVTASGVANASTDIPIVLDVTAGPALTITPNPIEVTAIKDSAAFTQAVTVSSNGDALSFTAAATGASGANTWVTATPSVAVSGNTSNVTLNINPSALPTGTYNGSLTITPANLTPAIVVPIKLSVVAAAQLAVDNASLSFVYQIGATAPGAQTVNVSNPAGAQLQYTATVSTPNTAVNWLKVSGSGTAPGPLSISVDPAGLVAGTYNGTITLTATGIVSVTTAIQVQFIVSTTPLLTVSPQTVSFTTTSNVNPQPRQINIYTTSGAQTYAVAVQAGTDWLFVVPGNVATPQGSPTILSPSVFAKAAGTYTSKLIITTPAGAVTPTQTIEVPVTLTISSVASLQSNPAQVSFDITPGTTAFQRKDVSITSTDAQQTQFSVSVAPDSARSWLFSSLAGGYVSSGAPVPLSIVVSPSTLTAAGYDAEVLITPVGTATPVLHIPVTVRLAGQVTFAITPTGQVAFTADPHTSAQVKTVKLTSDPASTDFVAQSLNPDWLLVSTLVGNTGAIGTDLAIRVDPTSLNSGIYTGTINVSPISGNSTPLAISVKLTVGTPQALSVSPANLTFNYTRGQTLPGQQSLAVTSGSNVATFAVTQSTNNGNSSWIVPVVTSTTTPATVGVKVDPTGLAAGTYTGSVVVTGTGTSNGPQTVGITFVVQDLPTPVITDIQNGASFQSTAATPGLIITIRGSNMGLATGVSAQAASGFIPTVVSDTRVYFDSTLAPVLYVSDKQVNAIVPYEVNGRFSTTVVIERFGVRSNAIVLAVKDSQPGIFALDPGGHGQGAILNHDYGINGASNPAARGSAVQIFATGEGQTAPGGITGKLITTDLRKPMTLPVTVRIGGQNAEVTYYGSAPGLVSGALQVNAKVPANIGTGNQPIEMQIGTAISQTAVTVAVK